MKTCITCGQSFDLEPGMHRAIHYLACPDCIKEKQMGKQQYLGTSPVGAVTWLWQTDQLEDGDLELHFNTSNPLLGIMQPWKAKVRPDFFTRLAVWYEHARTDEVPHNLLPDLTVDQHAQLLTGVKDMSQYLSHSGPKDRHS